MQLSQAPSQLVEAWANGDSSKTNPIPVPSQESITPGAASWATGFPPLCDTRLSDGGIPPSMQDMNGGLYQMSAVDVWMCLGGSFPYNSTFSTAIGGYPKGARILMASGEGYWRSTVDNNLTDPDTSGAGWVADPDWAAPGTIGSTTPNTGAFTTLTATTPASSDDSANVATTAWCLLGFSILLAASGYIKFPTWMGGLTIQWGSAAAAEGTQGTLLGPIAFPIAFTNALFAVWLSNYDPSTTDYGVMPVGSVKSQTLTGFSFWWERNADHGVSADHVYRFFAIGY